MKNIKLINERGYVLIAGLAGAPDTSRVKTINIETIGEKDVNVHLLSDDTGAKAGAMVQKGYFQLGKVFSNDTLCIDFPAADVIHFRVATKEEVDESNKISTEKKAAKKASPKAAKTSTIERLLADNTIAPVEGKAGVYEYTHPVEVSENDQVTCLRKSGIFTVKSIDKTKGVISAEDQNKQHHYFSTKEVALAK